MAFNASFDLSSLVTAPLAYIAGENNRKSQEAMARQNIQLQEQFAKQGIQWRVADAQAAGLHPLVGAGIKPEGFSPVSIGDTSGGLGAMGQDLSRALKATMSTEDRKATEMQDLAIDKAKLENDVLRQEVNSRAIRNSRMGGMIGPQIPTGPSGMLSGPAMLAHLSRRPDRGGGDYPIGEEKMEVKPEAVVPFKGSRVMGVPWLSSPTTTLSGQNAEDRYGDEHPITKMAGWAAFLDDFGYTGMKSWGPYLDRQARDALRGGDRSRWSRGTRNMRGR